MGLARPRVYSLMKMRLELKLLTILNKMAISKFGTAVMVVTKGSHDLFHNSIALG